MMENITDCHTQKSSTAGTKVFFPGKDHPVQLQIIGAKPTVTRSMFGSAIPLLAGRPSTQAQERRFTHLAACAALETDEVLIQRH